MEWINVKNKMPEDRKWVQYYDPELTYSNGRIEYCIGFYYEEGGYWESDGLESKTVTHWKELDKKPKK